MKRFVALAFCLILTGFCAAQTEPVRYGIFRQEGIASWYGQEFAGRPTASGELFNPALLTAAHPALPFGTMLRVTNRANGRQVTVRVNDRGPFVPARIIDVSRAAAEQLDILGTGTAPVLVESISQIALPSQVFQQQGTQQQSGSFWQAPQGQVTQAAPQSVMPGAQGGSRGAYYDAELGGTVLQPLEGPAPLMSWGNDAAQAGATAQGGARQYQAYQAPPPAYQAPPPAYQAPPPAYQAPPPVSTPDAAGSYQVIPGPVIIYQSAPIQNYGNVTSAPQLPAPASRAAPPALPAAPQPEYHAVPPPQYQSVPAPQAPAATAPQYQAPAQPAVQVPPVPAAVPGEPAWPGRSTATPAAAVTPAASATAAAAAGPAVILPAMPPAGSGKTYRIQAGSFRSPRNAVEAFDRLKNAGLSPAYERNGDYYRVVLAALRPEQLPQVAEKLGAAGFREVLIREE